MCAFRPLDLSQREREKESEREREGERERERAVRGLLHVVRKFVTARQ